MSWFRRGIVQEPPPSRTAVIAEQAIRAYEARKWFEAKRAGVRSEKARREMAYKYLSYLRLHVDPLGPEKPSVDESERVLGKDQ